ncbi:MAG: hypothetical protein WC565_03360 [Parcubacteria group bacterium]|jgi:hypothetical protein
MIHNVTEIAWANGVYPAIGIFLADDAIKQIIEFCQIISYLGSDHIEKLFQLRGAREFYPHRAWSILLARIIRVQTGTPKHFDQIGYTTIDINQ